MLLCKAKKKIYFFLRISFFLLLFFMIEKRKMPSSIQFEYILCNIKLEQKQLVIALVTTSTSKSSTNEIGMKWSNAREEEKVDDTRNTKIGWNLYVHAGIGDIPRRRQIPDLDNTSLSLFLSLYVNLGDTLAIQNVICYLFRVSGENSFTFDCV